MKKLFACLAVFCFAGLIGIPMAQAADKWTTFNQIEIKDNARINEQNYFKIYPSGNTIFAIDKNGFINRDDIVTIDSVDDLTALSGETGFLNNTAAVAGASVFWAEWGKTYYVDPETIARHPLGDPSGTTGILNFTGVSAFLRCVGPEDDKKTITFIYGPPSRENYTASGATGFWTATRSGATALNIYGPLIAGGSGITSFARVNKDIASIKGVSAFSKDDLDLYGSGMTEQTVVNYSSGFRSDSITIDLTLGMRVGNTASCGSGVSSFFFMDKPGESVTYQANYGSDVSAFVVKKNLIDN